MALANEVLHKVVTDNAKDLVKDEAEEIVGRIAAKSAGLVFALVSAFAEAINEENHKKLDETKETEGCPHIKVLQGTGGPFIDMIGYLNTHVGIAWQNGDGNTQWYYHPDPTFGPTMQVGYISLPDHPTKQITDNGRGDCQICQNIRKAR